MTRVARSLTLLVAFFLVAAPLVAAEPRVAVPPPTAKALQYYRSGGVLWTIAVLWGPFERHALEAARPTEIASTARELERLLLAR